MLMNISSCIFYILHIMKAIDMNVMWWPHMYFCKNGNKQPEWSSGHFWFLLSECGGNASKVHHQAWSFDLNYISTKANNQTSNDKLSPEWYQISQAHRVKERSLCSVWEGDTSVCGENRGQGCRNKLSSTITWLEWFLWWLNEVNTGNDHSPFLVNNLPLMMYLNLPSHFIPDYSHCQLYCLPVALISDRPNLMSPCRAVV